MVGQYVQLAKRKLAKGETFSAASEGGHASSIKMANTAVTPSRKGNDELKNNKILKP